MGTLPLPTPPSAPAPKDTFSKIVLLGTSIFGGGAGLYLAYQLVRAEPVKAYGLLQSWGPGYLLALFIAWALYMLLRMAVESFARSSEHSTAAVADVAVQMKAMAVALQASADKDDRERDRLATLVEYSASQSRQALEQLQSLAVAVDRLAAHIETLGNKGS